MNVIIDRFEGDFAVVELPDLSMVNLPIALVPGAKEGDVVKIIICENETDERKKRIEGLAKRLWNE